MLRSLSPFFRREFLSVGEKRALLFRLSDVHAPVESRFFRRPRLQCPRVHSAPGSGSTPCTDEAAIKSDAEQRMETRVSEFALWRLFCFSEMHAM